MNEIVDRAIAKIREIEEKTLHESSSAVIPELKILKKLIFSILEEETAFEEESYYELQREVSWTLDFVCMFMVKEKADAELRTASAKIVSEILLKLVESRRVSVSINYID